MTRRDNLRFNKSLNVPGEVGEARASPRRACASCEKRLRRGMTSRGRTQNLFSSTSAALGIGFLSRPRPRFIGTIKWAEGCGLARDSFRLTRRQKQFPTIWAGCPIRADVPPCYYSFAPPAAES